MTEVVKSYLLRVEAINLVNFVTDSEDLSTIRGAGLLLLNAGRFLRGRSDVDENASSAGLFTTVDGKVWFEGRIQLELVSAGASITLFSFRATEVDAQRLRVAVEKWLRTGAGKPPEHEYSALRHAT